MYQAFVLLVLSGLVAAALARVGDDDAMAQVPRAQTLALDFALYRTAVIRYVQAHPNPAFTGSIANASLPAVGVFVPNPLWRNYVSGSTVVVYASSAPGVDIVGALEGIAQHSVFAGALYAGTVVASATATTASAIRLPAAVVAPNGVPVWEARNVF